ncbi:uncharacterized protein LOC143300723 [Babylonia areolata]|uniref:uncharacterized protein LOC143300723 n=1 Tax=Babylonia areolata TaxID=304850 RepID=UPI003FD5F59B
MIGFGVSSEDLVYEMSHQMEVQLVMQKLHALPPGGQYSARRLINLSTSPLSHRKPQEWDDLLYRFKGDSILLKPEEVRYFEPCDYQLPDGEMTYRNLDTDARVIAKW